MAKFNKRLEAPAEDNPFYVNYSRGGYNTAIIIDEENGCVLPNCVGFAQGCYREEHYYGGDPDAKNVWNAIGCYLAGDAHTFYDRAQEAGLPVGQTPKIGSIIVWETDTYGHVAVVQEVRKDGTILTANSAWNGSYFYLQELSPDNNYAYKERSWLIGFVYPYIDFEDEEEETEMTREEKEIYVGECYAEYLGRPADKSGLDSYCDLIPDDASWDDDLSAYVDNNIKNSEEYKNTYKKNAITNFYKILLDREPDEAGMDTYMGYARLRDIYRDIYNSEEARNKRGE